MSVLRGSKKLYALLLLYCPALARWYFTRKFEQKTRTEILQRTHRMYDFLVVGAGLFGAVFAHEAKRAGKRSK